MRIREAALGAVLAAILAAGVALTVPPPQTPVVTVPAVVAPAPSSLPPLPAQAGPARPQSGSAQPVADWRAMHARYAGARNLRAFFYELLRKPEDGAVFYAFGILDTCRRAMSKASLELTGERGAAAQALRQRCDFTPEGLDDAERELRAVRNLDLRDDPLLESTVSYLGADGPEGRAKVLLAAFEQGDSRLVASLLTPAIEAGMPPGGATDGNADALGLPIAAALLACRLGADCGPDAPRTLELCMTRGWCAGSVPAALRQGLGKQFAVLDRIGAAR
jgi:hypothetical protein